VGLATWRKRSDRFVVTNENGGVAEREWMLEVFATDTGIERPHRVFVRGEHRGNGQVANVLDPA
jgi:hypothetical protein